MTAFDSKSIFLWNVPTSFGGDPVMIAGWLHECGFKTIMPKMADGAYEFRPSLFAFPLWLRRVNVDQNFVDAMHLFGISVIGWGFCYGKDAEGEGRIAAQLCDKYGLDGWAFDIESSFESYTDAVGHAGKMWGKFRDNIVNKVPVAVCSWAYYWSSKGSQIHNPHISELLMAYCDYLMPMTYWNRLGSDGKPVQMTDAQVIAYCEGSVTQQKKITTKPVIPVLRAYTGDAGFMNAGNILAAGTWARSNFSGASWWFADSAVKALDITEALEDVPGWAGDTTPPPPDPDPVTPPPDDPPLTQEPVPAIPGPFELFSHQEAGEGWNWNGPLDAYPAVVHTRGSKGQLVFSKIWKAALKLIMTPVQWEKTWKPKNRGWNNDGVEGHVKQIEFSHNKKWVTGINGDGWYEYDVYYMDDPPPNLSIPFDKYRRGVMTVDYKYGHDNTGGVIVDDYQRPYISIAWNKKEKLRIDPKYMKPLVYVPFTCHVDTGDGLNVRNLPGTVGTSVLTSLLDETPVTVFELRLVAGREWGRITAPGSVAGWVALWLTDWGL